MRLEDLKIEARVRGIVPSAAVTVTSLKWHGADAVSVTYIEDSGNSGPPQVLYRDAEARLEIVPDELQWSFDGDGAQLRLASEARRISLGYLFDPLLAVHGSTIEALPHQITAVYGEMLPRQPLRFLLADDPGAGKTIMAGLLIKELMIRGDVRRCLVCVPGSLVEQWQDEMQQRFGLDFRAVNRASMENSSTGNPFADEDLVIGRLDQMARSEEFRARLEQTSWDLIICDEAHKMSAHYYGQEKSTTKRYDLGVLLEKTTRHFLLMTATPHAGNDENFGLLMALLDRDRFEGKPRDGSALDDAQDMMRRMIKEDLCRFDGTRLFPERRAYTVPYELSSDEKALYEVVTDYVTEEMNRADRLRTAGQGRRGNNVGFALTVLQRRLASSPEAIYRSLQRRHKRLTDQLADLRRRGVGSVVVAGMDDERLPDISDAEDYEDFYDEGTEDEIAAIEEEVLDRATAATTIVELEHEIRSLQALEEQARQLRNSGRDRKWEELSKVLQSDSKVFAGGKRGKLIIFTEHRDTLNYLERQITGLLGRHSAVETIHGGLFRDKRRAAQENFLNNPEVMVLLATDAAGEGVNLQRAHLMVNYDLPWNPNRIEQRFGRIHRIGQTEVCHLWNLVAADTREGAVYQRLLMKLETISARLGGRVFDVLGQAYEGKPLRDLLLDAIRYGQTPEARARLFEQVETPLDEENLNRLLAERALAAETMRPEDVQEVRENMERAEARRLQPHHIRGFFVAAFGQMGGRISSREAGRYEITRVPAALRSWLPRGARKAPVLERYERVCFEKDYVQVAGKPPASLICPGHPLLEATVEAISKQHADLLKQGAALVDRGDAGTTPRLLVYLEHTLVDGRKERDGSSHVVSRRLEFVEIPRDGAAVDAGCAPFLDYEPPTSKESALIAPLCSEDWLRQSVLTTASDYAIIQVGPRHESEVRRHVEALVDKTRAAVRARLTREIAYYDRRANELKDQELSGKTNDRLNSSNMRKEADKLQARLKEREGELDLEAALSSRLPVIVGAAFVVPQGLLDQLQGETTFAPATFAKETKEVERLAMEAVMAAERALGFEPFDVSPENRGYDVESRCPTGGALRFIEVKGRVAGADTVTVTRNEIIVGLNQPDQYVLAVVSIDEGAAQTPRYIRQPFDVEPGFEITSVNYDLAKLLLKAEEPS